MAGSEAAVASASAEDQPTAVSPSAARAVDVLGMLRRGDRLGPYIIAEPIGTGGMGVVFAALDPRLQRRIALKVIRADREEERESTRLSREARAMAAVSHPNIVGVYDVGRWEGGVFIAMDLVEGKSLAQWLHAGRDTAEIVATFMAAGRGLAAAHGAGLVHRDFKPANVLVGDDGRVVVVDFGIARPHGLADSSGECATSFNSAEDFTVTRPGEVAGTPSYMAPEQHRGDTLDPSVDQYAFCVALFEALHGWRPFAASSLGALARKKDMQQFSAGRRRPIPTWLDALLRRGLSADRAGRFPSMDDLLVALRGPPPRRAVRGIAVAALTSVLVGAAWAGLGAAPNECGLDFALLWDEPARARVHDAIMATEATYAGDAWTGLAEAMELRERDWATAQQEACRAAHTASGAQAATVDRQRACLEDQRRQIHATVEVLGAVDGTNLDRVALMTEELPRAQRCDALGPSTEPPPAATAEARAAVEAVREDLRKIDALERAARIDAAFGTAVDAMQRAEATGYDPLIAEAKVALGMCHGARGETARAVELLEAGYWLAADVDHPRPAARAAWLLCRTIAVHVGEPADALVWVRHARSMLDRLGGDDEVEAHIERALGRTLDRMGDHDAALTAYQRALDLRIAVLGPDAYDVGTALTSLGTQYTALGRFDEAHARFDRARPILERSGGSAHPGIATLLNEQANAFVYEGRFDEARVALQEARRIDVASHGEKHPQVAVVDSNLANVMVETGDFDGALAAYERALEIKRATLRPDHPELSIQYNNIGRVHLMQGRFDDAYAMFERARELAHAGYGPEHPRTALALVNMAIVRFEQKDFDEAVRLHTDALPLVHTAMGSEHPWVAFCLNGRGRALYRLGDIAGARADLEEALRLRATAGVDPTTTAETQLALAQVLTQQGEDAERARALAISARDAQSEHNAAEVARIDEFLALLAAQ